MPPMMPPGASSAPPRPLHEVIAAEKAEAERKKAAALRPPPDSEPHPRESKAGNLPPERPAIGSSQAESSENFGSQFQAMKSQLIQGDGESRKDFKKRIHASIRAVKKGGQPITTEEQPRAKPSKIPAKPTQTPVNPYTPPPRSSPPAASEVVNDEEGPTRSELVARDSVWVPKEGVRKSGFLETAKKAAKKEEEQLERLS